MNKKGFIVLDDYMWWHYKDLTNNPASPINDFIKDKLDQISRLVVWHQVIIQKK